MKSTKDILKDARAAKAQMTGVSESDINRALGFMAEELVLSKGEILKANAEDILAAESKISEAMIDRLRLSEERILSMARGIGEIVLLPYPVGRVLKSTERENGLLIERVSVPIGAIAIIYESRPNVTSDAAALAIKSGNACVLRGGKEAYRSNRAIADALIRGIRRSSLPECAVQLVDDTTRASANELMTARGYIDLLIPRGGAGLIRACVEGATVPTLETGTGICHIYIDSAADLTRAVKILANAKCSRPSVCNAAEVCLVHKDVADKALPMIKAALVDERIKAGKTPVELRLDGAARAIIDGVSATDSDFDTEFLDYILAIRVVSSLSEAIDHIREHSTHHSEAIITEDECAMTRFTTEVDSAAVYVNASTRFTDGGEFGLGCEMGISTQKMHARGPVGIEELTTYKYIIKGNGQVR